MPLETGERSIESAINTLGWPVLLTGLRGRWLIVFSLVFTGVLSPLPFLHTTPPGFHANHIPTGKLTRATVEFFFCFAHFYFPASGQAVVTGAVPSPPRFLPSIFIAHRVQQSHFSSIVH